jgi:hypothetical protein
VGVFDVASEQRFESLLSKPTSPSVETRQLVGKLLELPLDDFRIPLREFRRAVVGQGEGLQLAVRGSTGSRRSTSSSGPTRIGRDS